MLKIYRKNIVMYMIVALLIFSYGYGTNKRLNAFFTDRAGEITRLASGWINEAMIRNYFTVQQSRGITCHVKLLEKNEEGKTYEVKLKYGLFSKTGSIQMKNIHNDELVEKSRGAVREYVKNNEKIRENDIQEIIREIYYPHLIIDKIKVGLSSDQVNIQVSEKFKIGERYGMDKYYTKFLPRNIVDDFSIDLSDITKGDRQ